MQVVVFDNLPVLTFTSCDVPLAGAEAGSPSSFSPEGLRIGTKRATVPLPMLSESEVGEVAERQRDVVAVGLCGRQAREQRRAELRLCG